MKYWKPNRIDSSRLEFLRRDIQHDMRQAKVAMVGALTCMVGSAALSHILDFSLSGDVRNDIALFAILFSLLAVASLLSLAVYLSNSATWKENVRFQTYCKSLRKDLQLKRKRICGS